MKAGSVVEPSAQGRNQAVGRAPALDGIRALALFGVVGAHMLGTSGVMDKYSGTETGVVLWAAVANSIDFFFIISGFVLFLPVIKRSGEFGSKVDFWVARGARLLPAYWLVLALCLLLIVLLPPSPLWELPPVNSIAAHFFAIHGPFRMLAPGDIVPGFGLVGPVWMISLVIGFYVVLPFVAKPYFRHPFVGLAAAAGLTIGWKLLVDHSPAFFDALSDGSQAPGAPQRIALDQLPGWSFSFALGMTGAWLWAWARLRYEPEQLARYALRALPLVLIVYVLAALEYGSTTLEVTGRIGPSARGDIFSTLVGSASKAALVAVIITGPMWIQRPFTGRAAGKLAEWSYGVYLIHILIVVYALYYLDLLRDGSIEALLIWTAVVVPASIVWAYLSRRFVEVPARRWIENRMKSPRETASRPVPSG